MPVDPNDRFMRRTVKEAPPAETGRLACGQVLEGKYRLRAEVGSGGMAQVFLADDLRLKREVALKISRPDVVSDPELCLRFLREAEVMAQLRHPNVIDVYDVGAHEGCPYLVMPFHRGDDLLAWCQRQGGTPLPVEVVLTLVEQICAGLAAMHEAGLIHRDIKPSNILVDEHGGLVLADLGLSHSVHDDERMVELGGTPGFLAPELVLGRAVGPELALKADVYAAGVTAYWLLTGGRPAATDFEEQERTIGHEVTPPSRVHAALPSTFDEPVLRALATDPAQRPDPRGFYESLAEAWQRAQRPGSGRPCFVVVVDDDAQSLELIEEIVHEVLPGSEVLTLEDPRAALAVLEQRRPDLLIADLQMPHINGIELTASVRSNPENLEVPIIILSAVGGATDWQVLKEMGAARFLVKPVDPDDLFDAIRRVMKLKGEHGSTR